MKHKHPTGLRIGYISAALLSSGIFASGIVAAQGNKSAAKPEPDVLIEKLYRSMSLPDSLDYSRDYFERNVNASLKARSEMPWGKEISDELFENFVVPLRTNNETLDESRIEFYKELAPRVRSMNMEQAALEVNHWAHEKVTYRPSDARTSSPMASVKTSWGRCGEESAFVVAAMRSVCIPARQVYTPRWAHTDDNHAWVEVFVNGKWQFLGGCEPEPILNKAWFNAPASRGMLMNSRTDGIYSGTEEILFSSPYYTLINVTKNYAPTATALVKVTDAAGRPVKDADVSYCLYNYAEFYPIARRKSDSNGEAYVTTGKGDLLVWAVKGDSIGMSKISVGKDTPVPVVAINHKIGDEFTFDLDLVPPVQGKNLPVVSEQQETDNNRRKAEEDAIRNAYMATFAKAEESKDLGLDNAADIETMSMILPASYGNHQVIKEFVKTTPDRRKAVGLLKSLSEKDWRDVELEVLRSHYAETKPMAEAGLDSLTYFSYLANPRVSYEWLTPYKKEIRSGFSSKEQKKMASDPRLWVEWVRKNIKVSGEKNPRGLNIRPISVWKHRRDIDPHSRDIFFVAGARSLGIPTRLNPLSDKPEYTLDGKTWQTVEFGTSLDEESPKGMLALDFTPTRLIEDPRYLSSFSVCRIENGSPRQLTFPDFAPLSTILKNPAEVDAGNYMLVSGQRLADGTVLAKARFFNIADSQLTRVPLEIRQDTTRLQVIGSLNSEALYHDLASGADKSILSTTGRGYYVLGLISPNHEPSAHALNDISAIAHKYAGSGLKTLLLFRNEDDASRFNMAQYPSLPGNVVFGIDNRGAIAAELTESLRADTRDLPVFVIADTFNRVVYFTQGYTIHLGEKLLDAINRLND